MPRLTEEEKRLLADNEGCYKCRCFFVNHRSSECPNRFPATANYRALTRADVECARQSKKAPPVAAISNSHPDEDGDVSGKGSSHPVTVVVKTARDPIAYMPPNETQVLDGDDISDSSVSGSPSLAQPAL